MIEKIARKIAPVIIPAVMLVAGCKVDKPVKENYLNKEFTSLGISGISDPCFRDFDKDGKVDAIIDAGSLVNSPIYIAEGYEKYFKAYRLTRAQKMTPEMREVASKIAQGINELNYKIAEKEYEESLERKKKREEKR